MSDIQQQVQQAIARMVKSGAERGVQVAVYQHGEQVVDAVGPLGVADELYFGMPAAEHGRLARLEDQEGAADMMAGMPPDSPMFRAGPAATFPSAALGNRADILAADIPAGGKTSARAIARVYAALMGDVPGVRLISPERLRAFAVTKNRLTADFSAATQLIQIVSGH
ncbi:hypothetical protein [Nonomuraea sp. NPDC049028]|uniref:hypothetical protein n=1 Tax=Nonomuraea sp. NPDC049028 TaxID=3364348 RepID=UPI0037218DA5